MPSAVVYNGSLIYSAFLWGIRIIAVRAFPEDNLQRLCKHFTQNLMMLDSQKICSIMRYILYTCIIFYSFIFLLNE